MKKLMIILGAIACSMTLHAATVSWGAAVAGPSYEDMSVGQVAGLLYSSTAFSGLATTLSGTTVGATADNGGSLVSTYSLTAADVDPNNGTFRSTYSRADSNGGVNGYYQIVLMSTDNTQFAVIDMGSVSGISDTSSVGNVWNDWDTAGTDWLGANGYTGSVAVPEPTSGLLLLLGMAGLALKRKRA